jgi:hypothetical protein
MGATAEDAAILKDKLAKQGYELYDVADQNAIDSNLGRLPSGEPVVVDGGAVLKKTTQDAPGAAAAAEGAEAGAASRAAVAEEPRAAAGGFDPDAYVREQVAAREAARKAGSPSGVLAKGRSFLADLKTKLVDSTAPIQDLLDATVKREKITLAPSRDIANSIDRVYRAPTMAGQFAKDNEIEAVIREVPDLDTLDQYLVAKHARTIEATGRATGRDLAADA